MSKPEHYEYVNNNIEYTVSEKVIDGDGIIDVIIKLKDKSNDKIIGYIGTRLVELYQNPSDTFILADDLDATLGLEIAFLLETNSVRRFYNDSKIRNSYNYNYIGRTYQFDLLPEYQNKGIEEYFIDNLGHIIQDRKNNIWMMASTFYIAGKDCDAWLVEADFHRKRAFEEPISVESFSRCDKLIDQKWKDYEFSYVNYATFK